MWSAALEIEGNGIMEAWKGSMTGREGRRKPSQSIPDRTYALNPSADRRPAGEGLESMTWRELITITIRLPRPTKLLTPHVIVRVDSLNPPTGATSSEPGI
jgi:hypothetical protein